MNKIKIIRSLSRKTHLNLAYESFLYSNKSQYDINQSFLYFYINQKNVICGRNQNIYRECDLDYVKENDILVIRRKSGGGAVYFDENNPLFSFIRTPNPQDLPYKELNSNLVIKAVKNLGIDIQESGRNDLVYLNPKDQTVYKVSGSAFRYSEKLGSLHHGTMLIDVDYSSINKILTPSKIKLESKSVDSVKSRIINLKEINKEVNVESFIESLTKTYFDYAKSLGYQVEEEVVKEEEMESHEFVKQESAEMLDWNWNLGNRKFAIEIENYIKLGLFSIGMDVEDGKIDEVRVYSDCIDLDVPEVLQKILKGADYTKQGILARFEQSGWEHASQFKNWIVEELKLK